jgi:ribosomal protein S18 acetylase RimI-like enzyme
MSNLHKPGEPFKIHTEHVVDGETYLFSNEPSRVSLDFVMSTYNADATYWATPMDRETTRLMVANSSILGVYRIQAQDASLVASPDRAGTKPAPPEQVGMARFITDHVTHAYLTDIYILPSLRGKGLGTLLVRSCDSFINGLPFLRKMMLSTSNPKRNAAFYQSQLRMSVPVQDPERHLVMVRTGSGSRVVLED